MRLAKDQANVLFETIVASGLNPRECALTNSDSLPNITHLPSESQISFIRPDPGMGNWYVSMQIEHGRTQNFKDISWEEVQEKVREWAKWVLIPNFWSELINSSEALAGHQYENIDNAMFTLAEQAEISTRLRAISGYIEKTYSLSREQVEIVQERFREAEVASKRIGRKDWLLLFSGTLLTLIISGILTPEIVQHILMAALHSLGHLFGLGGPARRHISPK